MNKHKTSVLSLLGGKKRSSAALKSSVFRKKDIQKLLSDSSPFGVKESYGAIRTRLDFVRRSEKCPVFAVTSMTPGDGKTLNCIKKRQFADNHNTGFCSDYRKSSVFALQEFEEDHNAGGYTVLL